MPEEENHSLCIVKLVNGKFLYDYIIGCTGVETVEWVILDYSECHGKRI